MMYSKLLGVVGLFGLVIRGLAAESSDFADRRLSDTSSLSGAPSLSGSATPTVDPLAFRAEVAPSLAATITLKDRVPSALNSATHPGLLDNAEPQFTSLLGSFSGTASNSGWSLVLGAETLGKQKSRPDEHLALTTVPEPSVYSLLGFAAVILLSQVIWRRRAPD